jgi:hypothetical protein
MLKLEREAVAPFGLEVQPMLGVRLHALPVVDLAGRCRVVLSCLSDQAALVLPPQTAGWVVRLLATP